MNLAKAERTLAGNPSKGSGHTVVGDELNTLIRMIGDVTGSTSRVGGDANDVGDKVSGYEVLNVGGMSKEELGVEDIGIFGRIDANLTAGNTPEQRRTAQRQRSNFLAGRPLDAPEEIQAPEPLPQLNILENFGNFPKEIKGLGQAWAAFSKNPNAEGSFLTLQQANPGLSDKDLLDALEQADTLISNLGQFSRSAETDENPQKRTQAAQARDQLKSFLDSLGFQNQAHETVELGSGRMSNEKVYAGVLSEEESGVAGSKRVIESIQKELLRTDLTEDERVALTKNIADEQAKIDAISSEFKILSGVTGAQGSAANIAKAKEQILRGRTPQQTAAYQRAYPDKSVQGAPVLHRGSRTFTGTEGTAGMTTDAQGRLTTRQGTGAQPTGLDGTETPEGALPQVPTMTPEQTATRSARQSATRGATLPPDQAAQAAANDLANVYDSQLTTEEQIRQDTIGGIEESEKRSDALANKWMSTYLKQQQDMQTKVDKVYNQSQKLLQDREDQARKKLAWEEQTKIGEARKAAVEEVMQMESDLAFSGGGTTGAALKDIRQAENEWKRTIINLGVAYDFKEEDLAIEYAQKRMEIDNTYIKDSNSNLDKYLTHLQTIENQQFTSEEARRSARITANNSYLRGTEKIRKDKAEAIKADNKAMNDAIDKKRDDDQAKEQDALDQIEYLSAHYAPEEVADAIRELGKNVTSFDATSLAGISPLDVKKKIAGAQSGAGNGFGGLFPMPEQKPLQSYEEFVDQKIAAMEDEQNQSFGITKRDEIMLANESIWKKNYTASISPSIDSLPSSGNSVVDAAAKDVLNGVFGGVDPIKRAAETRNVPRSAIAQQIDVYRKHGYVPDFQQFTDTQVERYEPFIKRIRGTDEYKTASNASFIVRRIESVLSLKTGQGDSTAIELLQRGMKDPGMAVRQDDINRIVAAVPWASKFDPVQWKDKVLSGTLFNENARQQFREVLLRLGGETIRAYNEEHLPNIRIEAKRLGLPESAFRDLNDLVDYGSIAEGDKIQDTVNSYGYGSSSSE